MEEAKEPPQGEPSSWWQRLLRRVTGPRRVNSEADLQELIDASEAEGIINEEEGEMFHSIFQFGDTIVREVMIPRTDMSCCEAEAPLDQVRESILETGHSRIPVFEGSMDRIVGLVYAKDLLHYWGQDTSHVRLEEIMRQVYFVPESKRLDELLQEFRTQRVHIAVVVDEYGGTSGLTTLEDLLEEIVGDIQDEYDLEEAWQLEEEPGCLLVDARLNIEQVESYFQCRIPRDQFDTVGGYVFSLLGRVPQPGETVQDEQLQLTIIEADERKIFRVRIQPAEPQQALLTPARDS